MSAVWTKGMFFNLKLVNVFPHAPYFILNISVYISLQEQIAKTKPHQTHNNLISKAGSDSNQPHIEFLISRSTMILNRDYFSTFLTS